MTQIPFALALVSIITPIHAEETEHSTNPENANQLSQPNIILFLADDMSWHDHGATGNPDVKTPNIDQLASEGLRFEFAYTATAMCSPTRQQLLTGIYPVRNGAYPNHSKVHEGTRSIVHHLNAQGYTVAHLGKRHIGPNSSFPFEWLGGHTGGMARDLPLELLETFINKQTTNNPEQPWCVVIASSQPHLPWTRGNPSQYQPPDNLWLPPYVADIPKERELLSHYYAEVTYLDDQVGRTAAILNKTNTASQTLFVFTSEQGAAFPFAKWTCYEAGLRVSLIMRWPGVIDSNRVSTAMVEYVDILPTFVEIAGGDPTKSDTGLDGATNGGRGFDGISFLPVILNKTNHHKEHVFGVHTNHGENWISHPYPIRSIRNDQYKLIWNINHTKPFTNIITEDNRPNSQHQQRWNKWLEAASSNPQVAILTHRYQHRPEFELYDLHTDPFEMHNLADQPEYTKTIETLHHKLKEWMKQQGDEGMTTELQANQRN